MNQPKRATQEKLFLLQKINLVNKAVDKNYITKMLNEDKTLASIFYSAHAKIELITKQEETKGDTDGK